MSIKIIKKTSTHNTSLLNNRKIEWAVLHYTAGTSSKSGNAANNAQYFASTDRQVSADFIVDDEYVIQYNPDIKNRYTWGAGGPKYTKKYTSESAKFYGKCTNSNCINIEMCSNKKNTSSLKIEDTDWYFTDETINNTVELVKKIMKDYNIDINHVIMHHHVTGKVCPQPWTLTESSLTGWKNFLKKLKNNTNSEEKKFPNLPFNVEILIDNLNCRQEPAMTAKIKNKTGKGIFTISKISGDWGFIESFDGWIYLKNTNYYKIVEKEKIPYLIQITVDKLNIRNGAGKQYKIIGTISDKKKYTIIQEKGEWGKLKSNIGWIYLPYTKKV